MRIENEVIHTVTEEELIRQERVKIPFYIRTWFLHLIVFIGVSFDISPEYYILLLIVLFLRRYMKTKYSMSERKRTNRIAIVFVIYLVLGISIVFMNDKAVIDTKEAVKVPKHVTSSRLKRTDEDYINKVKSISLPSYPNDKMSGFFELFTESDFYVTFKGNNVNVSFTGKRYIDELYVYVADIKFLISDNKVLLDYGSFYLASPTWEKTGEWEVYSLEEFEEYILELLVIIDNY